MSKLVSPMIMKRSDGLYYMKEVYCRYDTYKKTIPINQKPPRCIYCNTPMEIRWKLIGNKLDYSDYWSQRNAKLMARGKDIRKRQS